MKNYREIIRLKNRGMSNSSIALSCHCSRNTVADVWERAQDKNISWPLPQELTDSDIERVLYPEKISDQIRMIPDYEYIFDELAKPGVTLSLLWSEYCEQCEIEHKIPYQHTQFYDKYRAYASTKKATLRIRHKPGDAMEVDWVGDTVPVWDSITGESYDAYVFVACLPCSQYCYAEAFLDMKSNHWIEAHIHAFEYFGGITRILIPDNLKTGVIKNTMNELILNRSYHEMAEYYGTAIIPARPVSPKDKPSAEKSVGVMETWIIASLRRRKFFSVEELNIAIQKKLQEFNERPFQKRKGSRLTAFQNEEQPFLMPLPASPYETAVWSKATIQHDYLITVEDCKYSVPYEYIGKEVDIRTTEKSIEVFFHDQRIASHIRRDHHPDPIYVPEHMPENHRKYLEYDSEHFLKWADSIGDGAHQVVQHFLTMHRVEKQGYKSCVSLMRLADKYSTERLERACEKALRYTPKPSLKNIRLILRNGQDRIGKGSLDQNDDRSIGITRGEDYFKGGDRA